MANAFTAGGRTAPEEEEKTVDENEEERCEFCGGSLEVHEVIHATVHERLIGFPAVQEITTICEACPEGRDLADQMYDAIHDEEEEVCECCFQDLASRCKCEYP